MKTPAGPAKDFCIVHATDTQRKITVVLGTADTPAEGLEIVAQRGRETWAKNPSVRLGVDEVRR